MADSVHEVLEKHNICYEVLPFYVMQEETTPGHKPTAQKLQAGFDVDIYGIKSNDEPRPGRDYALVYTALQKLVNMIVPQTAESCSIDVIPFPSRVVFDTKKNFEQQGMLRIRIAHPRLNEAAGEPEARAFEEVKARLQELGLSCR